MHRLLYILMVAIAVTACSGGNDTPEQAAVKAAKAYYDHLLAGRYAEFVNGIHGMDTMPADYRRQMEGCALMFVETHKKRSGGIMKIDTLYAERDKATGDMYAYLKICLADSAVEKIMVQMEEHDGAWRMK